jgi:hypothetical protein
MHRGAHRAISSDDVEYARPSGGMFAKGTWQALVAVTFAAVLTFGATAQGAGASSISRSSVIKTAGSPASVTRPTSVPSNPTVPPGD